MSAEAAEAARLFGGAPLRLITERENAVYEMAVGGARAALRLHRTGYQAAAAIRSELWWCTALAAEGVAVARPLTTPGGDLLVQLSTGRHASATAWVDGQPLGTAGSPQTGSADDILARYQALGRLLAAVHANADGMTLPAGFTRPAWDLAGLLGEAPFWGRFWEHPALSADEAALARRARDYLRERLADATDTGLIHADVLVENVIVNEGSLTLIDFDDCGFGFRGYDLGTALSPLHAAPLLPEMATALMDGYAALRPLDRAMIPAFMLMRCCASVGWTGPRMAPGDPVHRRYINRAVEMAGRVMGGLQF